MVDVSIPLYGRLMAIDCEPNGCMSIEARYMTVTNHDLDYRGSHFFLRGDGRARDTHADILVTLMVSVSRARWRRGVETRDERDELPEQCGGTSG